MEVFVVYSQRTSSNNYWLGGGMQNNLVVPFTSTLNPIDDDIHVIADKLLGNLMQTKCTKSVVVEIESMFPIIEELINMDNDENEQFFYHSDHLGSSAWITDAGGYVNQHLQYLPLQPTNENQTKCTNISALLKLENHPSADG